MTNLEIVSTEVDVNSILDSVESQRQLKKDLISENVSFPETTQDKLKIMKTFSEANGLEIKKVYSNTKKDYAFVGKKGSDKSVASISIWKDSNLGRFETTGSDKISRGLGYADLNSATGFSKFNEVSQ